MKTIQTEQTTKRGRPANQPKPSIGYCPKSEPKAVREKWKALYPTMVDYLAPTDRQIFLEICRMLVERENDYKMIIEKGSYYYNNNGEPRLAPWANRWDKAGDQLLKYLAKLSMSPTDRRRMLSNMNSKFLPLDEVEQADGYTGLEDGAN